MQAEEAAPVVSMECVPYPTEGGLCQDALQNALFSLECDMGESPLVLRGDQETNARQQIPLLDQSSPECREAVIPLLCWHLFGLCNSSGVSIQPTSGQCKEVRDTLCSTEWQAATAFGLDLPDCDSFPEEQALCDAPELISE